MKKTVITAIIATMLLSVSVFGNNVNLIGNGDFELPLVGDGIEPGTYRNWDSFYPADVPYWTVELYGTPYIPGPYGPVLEIWGDSSGNMPTGSAYSGNQCVELDSYDPTMISQVVSTIPGAQYDLSYAWRPRIGASDGMKVWIDGEEIGDHYGPAGIWTYETYPFTATGNSTTIAFAETGFDDQLGMLLDAVSLTLVEIAVDIDIKPGSFPNAVNINGNGVIPVAILGSAYFDVRDIDISTLSFAGLAVRVKGNDQPQCSFKDVSGDFSGGPEGAPDGYEDLVCQFVDDPALWEPGIGEATLTGELLDGTPFGGTDSIKVIE